MKRKEKEGRKKKRKDWSGQRGKMKKRWNIKRRIEVKNWKRKVNKV